jgi:hypothetical protein
MIRRIVRQHRIKDYLTVSFELTETETRINKYNKSNESSTPKTKRITFQTSFLDKNLDLLFNIHAPEDDWETIIDMQAEYESGETLVKNNLTGEKITYCL